MTVGAFPIEQRAESLGGYSEESRPLGSYAALMAAFNLALAGVLVRAHRANGVPERVAASDVALLGLATHKLSRLVAKDTVTAPLRAAFTRYEGDAGMNEVDESPRGGGARRAVGELLVCPSCIGQWIALGLLAGLLNAPRTTRVVGSLFAMQGISDFLHLGFAAARDRA